jgi:hypothetical protein
MYFQHARFAFNSLNDSDFNMKWRQVNHYPLILRDKYCKLEFVKAKNIKWLVNDTLWLLDMIHNTYVIQENLYIIISCALHADW